MTRTVRNTAGQLQHAGGDGKPNKQGGQYAVDSKFAPAGLDIGAPKRSHLTPVEHLFQESDVDGGPNYDHYDLMSDDAKYAAAYSAVKETQRVERLIALKIAKDVLATNADLVIDPRPHSPTFGLSAVPSGEQQDKRHLIRPLVSHIPTEEYIRIADSYSSDGAKIFTDNDNGGGTFRYGLHPQLSSHGLDYRSDLSHSLSMDWHKAVVARDKAMLGFVSAQLSSHFPDLNEVKLINPSQDQDPFASRSKPPALCPTTPIPESDREIINGWISNIDLDNIRDMPNVTTDDNQTFTLFLQQKD